MSSRAQTVLPGAPVRGVVPQWVARAATRSRPRPLRVGGGGGGDGRELGAGVGDLDAEGGGIAGESEVEVPAGDVAVAHGVRGELGGDEGDCVVDGGVVRVPPVVEAVRNETAGEPCAAWGGSEAHLELVGEGG